MVAVQTTFANWSDITDLDILRARASGCGGATHLLARQALRAAAGGGLEVAAMALDELALRFRRSARDPDASVVPRVGWFRVRDHVVWIGSCDPLEASCDCRDFVRSSLGACSHVFAVLRSPDPIQIASEPPRVRWDRGIL